MVLYYLLIMLEPDGDWSNKEKLITFVGIEPHPMETRQSMRVSGHKSCASLTANMVGLFATIAPSCQRYTSEPR